MIDLWAIERELHTAGHRVICGVDEAGRGPLAGPVVAAAVILPVGLQIGVDDSKKLTESQREALYEEICAQAIGYGIGLATEEEIDLVNILNATYLAMNRAIGALCGDGDQLSADGQWPSLQGIPDLCLIDGNRAEGVKYPNQCIVKGDSKCASIAAASILAKVTRDRIMVDLHDAYPQYGFDRHKGYPTKAHYAALDAYGVSDVHRESFLCKWQAGRI